MITWIEKKKIKGNVTITLWQHEHIPSGSNKTYYTYQWMKDSEEAPLSCLHRTKKLAWDAFSKRCFSKEAREAEEQEKFRQWQESMREEDDKE